MNILVTGGAGYVGTELVKKLASIDNIDQVIVYDNLSRKNYNFFLESNLPNDKIKFVKADILDSRNLEKWVKKVDFIYHLAAHVLTPFGQENPHQFEQVNHWGTAELSYLIEKYKKPILYLSSVSVYGLQNTILDKTQEPHPTSHYGLSKLRGEKVLQRLSDITDVYIMRSGNVYGYSKSMRFDAVINKFLFQAHFEDRLSVIGTGEQFRPFIHIESLINSLINVVSSDALEPGLYDLIERNMNILQLAEHFKEVYSNLEIIYISQDMSLDGLRVKKDNDLNQKYLKDEFTFVKELEEFGRMMSFKPSENLN